MSIRRTLARGKVEQRRRRRASESAEIKRLTLARNKALKEAGRSATLAEAREQARQAQITRFEAKERLAGRTGTSQAIRERRAQQRKKAKETIVSAGKSLGRMWVSLDRWGKSSGPPKWL